MKYINIFLASSISDMHEERIEMGNFVRTLNDRFMERGVYLRLHMCEDVSDELINERKQNEYNKIIESCDYFYIMFYRKAGRYTIEEFDVALSHFRKTGSPRIVTLFKELEGEPSEEVIGFMARLEKELQHYYTKFKHIDSVKLKLLLEMSRISELNIGVEFRDNAVFAGGERIDGIDTENLPFYENHEEIRKLRARISQLEADHAEAKRASMASPENEELWSSLCKISKEKNEALERLHEFELQLMQTTARLTMLTASGEYINERTRLAIELFENGKYDDAISILDREEFEKDKQRIAEKADNIKKELEALQRELTTKIDFIKSRGVNEGSAEEICSLYEDAKELALKYSLDMYCILEYIAFLRQIKRSANALELCELVLEKAKEKRGEDDGIVFLTAQNLLAVLYLEEKRYKEAEVLLDDCFQTYMESIAEDDELYEEDIQNTIGIANNIALLYKATDRAAEAERIYFELLEAYENIEIEGKELAVAMIFNNLANMYSDTGKKEQAEEYYHRALEAYERLGKNDPDACLPKIADISFNIANLYSSLWQDEDAEQSYLYALSIYTTLAEKDPEFYERDIAQVCWNLIIMYCDTERLNAAARLFEGFFRVLKKYKSIQPACERLFDELSKDDDM